MATLTVRVDDEAREGLEALARSKGIAVSVLMRDQIAQLLGRDVNMRRSDVPHSLTMTERLLLSNQAKILAVLNPDDAESYMRQSEALSEGYAGEYGDAFAEIRPELPRSECALAWDLLDMFRLLNVSIEALSPEDRETLNKERIGLLRFQGFDLSDELEGRLLSYVCYLVRGKRWEEIGSRLKEIGDGGNSHYRWLPSYRPLLDEYRSILATSSTERGCAPDAYRLNLNQLIQLADVRIRNQPDYWKR